MSEKKGIVSRWIGTMPKIGIRPIIDGRMNGVRESLEGQTMGLATAVAKFLSVNLHYPDGSPVECVIADSTIGGVTESALCAEKFARAGVGVSLTVTPCWCYGSETMDMDPFIPKAVWGLMEQKGQAQFISRRYLPAIIKKVSRLFPSMAMMFRIVMTLHFLKMYRKDCCASPAPGWPWR